MQNRTASAGSTSATAASALENRAALLFARRFGFVRRTNRFLLLLLGLIFSQFAACAMFAFSLWFAATALALFFACVAALLFVCAAICAGNGWRRIESENARAQTRIERLEANVEQSRNLLENSAELVFSLDDKGRLTFANQAAARLFGLSAESLRGSNFLSFVAPEDQFRVRLFYKKQFVRKYAESYCEFCVQTDRENRFRLAVKAFLIEENNRVTNFQVTASNATDAFRRAEVSRTAADYRNLFELANDAILIVEPQTEKILNANARACELYGFARAALVGRSLKEMSEYPARGEQYFSGVMHKGIYNEFETAQRRADGALRNLLVNASLIEFDAKPAILSIVRDITERKRSDAALRESEYRFRTLLESMNEGLLHVDDADRIQYANDHFCQMVGYSHEELINRVWTDFLLDAEERALIKKVNERRLRGIADGYELKLIKKTGETICSLVGGAPVYNSDNLIVGSMGVFTDISDRKRAEEQLLHNALHDALTGLPNRALFLEHLRHTIDRNQRRVGASFAVLFLDFDRFKVINDSLGHMEGDKLLIQIARRLEKSLRTSDIVARLGGDEFTILISELDEFNEVSEIVERIQNDLKIPFALAEREIFISASIGVAMSSQKYTKPEEMLRDADTAMYRAKAAGKARFQVFNPTMHNAANERLQLETELRHALERQEFCNYYQPIVELADNRLIGFESLVRWQHPTRGLILPGEFISTMEETGLIVALGIWVLRESCQQLREWQTRFQISCPDLTMSVNLSSTLR